MQLAKNISTIDYDRVVILQHNGGRLANQLWLYVTVYAFCLERGYQCINPSFYEYYDYFDASSQDKLCSRIGKFYKIYKKIFNFLPKKIVRHSFLFTYNALTSLFLSFTAKPYIDASTKRVDLTNFDQDEHSNLFKGRSLFICGWKLENSDALKKFQSQISKKFKPKDKISKKVTDELNHFRMQYKHIVGVHIRQSDFRSPEWKHLYISPELASMIVHDYLREFMISKDQTLFIICSDEIISKEVFGDLNIHLSHGTDIEDLFALSQTDTIIGTDSSYSDFASYLGNTHRIVMSNKGIDWKQYKNAFKS